VVHRYRNNHEAGADKHDSRQNSKHRLDLFLTEDGFIFLGDVLVGCKL
jgi:hypothetical protein